ncbi:unnamed protein product [Penicillium olsonii]|uniref:Myb-like domain-containing protein n=1 Tax=Penicillium olsonii TaxID=99116 RepID=A0A9W4N316_PENOL|nr:unnamed protein product [Penicillium olsonii]CAG8268652.1 unnamed protein product [Penicillium olsonii]
MSDTAELESDPGYSPSIPSQRSVTPEERVDVPAQVRDEKTNEKPDEKPDDVERQLGEALMQRSPPMRGSLLFLRAYKHLLSESQKEIDYTWSRHEDVFQVSQYGSVVWTSTEKEAFFNTLDRKGKGGIKELAAAIGTKSELEVMDYMKRLHQALEAQYCSDAQVVDMPLLADIPAAKEISQQGCEMLDDYADVLILKESLADAQTGGKQYGDYWNLSSNTASDLMDVIDGEDDGTVRGDLHLAATLLYVPDWIQLSRRLFMNFGGAKSENHWKNIANSKQNITAQRQTPSMTADSVVDFYTLSVSITRRLVQSSIFFAMSRLRGANRSGQNRKNHIRLSDVRAAIEVLNMKHRRPNFVDTARRNEVEIADVHHRKDWVPTPFTYEEVEEIIDKSEWSKYRSDAAMSGGVNMDDEENDNAESESEDSDDEGPEEATNDQAEPPLDHDHDPEIVDLDPPSSREDSPASSQPDSSDELEMDPEEMHADLADEAISQREEAMFMRLMDKSVPTHQPMKKEDADDQVNAPPERRARDEVFDWRSRVLYRSEWEEYGYNFADLKGEFEMPPLKRARLSEPEQQIPTTPPPVPMDEE